MLINSRSCVQLWFLGEEEVVDYYIQKENYQVMLSLLLQTPRALKKQVTLLEE